MDRRTFVGGLASNLLATPPVPGAERVERIYQIGRLELARAPKNASPHLDAFRRRLHELGWIEGRSVVIEPRYADNDSDRLATVTAELVGLKVDVIVTVTTPAALAAKRRPHPFRS